MEQLNTSQAAHPGNAYASAPMPEVVEEAQIVSSLLSIAKATRAFLTLLLNEIGLYPGQDQLLVQLQEDMPVSVSKLADQLAVRPSTVSKMLDRLIDKGYVSRSANVTDARQTMVLLTEEGLEAKEAVQRIWSRLEQDLVALLPDHQKRVVAAALAQTDELLNTKLRRLR